MPKLFVTVSISRLYLFSLLYMWINVSFVKWKDKRLELVNASIYQGGNKFSNAFWYETGCNFEGVHSSQTFMPLQYVQVQYLQTAIKLLYSARSWINHSIWIFRHYLSYVPGPLNSIWEWQSQMRLMIENYCILQNEISQIQQFEWYYIPNTNVLY